MDGIHDLGGIAGFGPVHAPPDEPVFAAEWERGVIRVQMAALRVLGAGASVFRHSIERMEPAHYLTSSYYEHWLTAVSTLMVEAGLVSQADLERRAGGRFPLARPAQPGRPPRSPSASAVARFAVGDSVRVRAWHPSGHTRAPSYVQGKCGVIERVDGRFNLPDLEAHGGGQVLDFTYSVRFSSRELWGEGGNDGETINVGLWETYLEPQA
jgi:nitrile hydratase